MPIYEIDAPDGKTYEIEGPAGASKDQVVQALLQKFPNAGKKSELLKEEKPVQFNEVPADRQLSPSEEASVLIVVAALVAFGFSAFLARIINRHLTGRSQKVWTGIAASLFGFGLMGVMIELVVHPINGLSAHHEKVFNYVFFNMLLFPALIGMIVWWSKGKSVQVNTLANERSEKNTDHFYAQALNEAEGRNRKDGLWSRCFAEADGDESKAKAKYIKERVAQLISESQS